MCRGTLKIHPSLKESYFLGKHGYSSGRWVMHCRTGRFQIFQHLYHHLIEFRLHATVCILVRVQSKDLLHLLHYKKCLSSLKSTDITLSHVIILRETNLNRAEPFSKYNRFSLNWVSQSLGYRQISHWEFHHFHSWFYFGIINPTAFHCGRHEK